MDCSTICMSSPPIIDQKRKRRPCWSLNHSVFEGGMGSLSLYTCNKNLDNIWNLQLGWACRNAPRKSRKRISLREVALHELLMKVVHSHQFGLVSASREVFWLEWFHATLSISTVRRRFYINLWVAFLAAWICTRKIEWHRIQGYEWAPSSGCLIEELQVFWLRCWWRRS